MQCDVDQKKKKEEEEEEEEEGEEEEKKKRDLRYRNRTTHYLVRSRG